MIRVAVTGRYGQLASSLIEKAAVAGDMHLIPLHRPLCDLTDPATIGPALASARPDVLISAAAYTAVDRAEQEAELAMRINAVAAGRLAAEAAARRIPLLHLSTDYIFDGSKGAPYVEQDLPNPLNVYGASKLAGERAIVQEAKDYAILRTSWVYSPFGANFVKTMLRLARERDRVAVVSDQLGAPSNALDLADAILAIARQMLEAPGDDRKRGIFHLSGAGITDWASFAEAIFADVAIRSGRQVAVDRILTDAYPTQARRPANSCLNNEKIRRHFGLVMPEWRQSLASLLTRMAQ